MLGLKFSDPAGNVVAQVRVVDRQLTVGRANDVDVPLPFKAISRHHARFFLYQGEVWIEDLGSSNGVLVAGQRITAATRLGVGDQARIGVINVRVVASDAPAAPVVAPSAPYPAGAPTMQPVRSPAFQPSPGPPPPAPPPASPPSPFDASVQAEPPTLGRPADSFPESPSPFDVPSSSPAIEDGPPTSPDQPLPHSETPNAPPPEPEDNPEALTVALPISPRLVGISGYLKDQDFYIDQEELTVGRVKGSHLVIEDASVSRRHAKIIQKDGSFILFDLRSYNGSFVNDEQVTKAELDHGDTVRFGDIPFRFLLTNEPEGAKKKKRKKRSARSRRLLILGSATIVLAVVVIAANILMKPEPEPPPPDPAAEQRALEAKVRQQLERGSAQLRQRDWEAASATLQGVLKIDPLNDEAVKGLEKARSERERESWLKEGERIADTGRDFERALSILTKIPQESTYYADTRVRVRQIKRTMAEDARNQGLSNCRVWRYQECQHELCRFFQLWPRGEPIPDEVRVRRALERAENRLKRRRDFEPCKIPEPGTGNEELDTELVKRYEEEPIRRTVISYYQGQVDDAIHTLSVLEKNRRYRDHRETIGKLLQQMIMVQNASSDAHRNVRDDQVEEAESSYQAMVKAEKRILPEPFKSHYVREVGTLLGDAYHRKGSEDYRSNRLREAFKNWSRGKQLAPNHPEILQSLLTMAGRAREICDTAAARLAAGDTTGAVSHYELCRDITPEDSSRHQEALEALEQLGN